MGYQLSTVVLGFIVVSGVLAIVAVTFHNPYLRLIIWERLVLDNLGDYWVPLMLCTGFEYFFIQKVVIEKWVTDPFSVTKPHSFMPIIIFESFFGMITGIFDALFRFFFCTFYSLVAVGMIHHSILPPSLLVFDVVSGYHFLLCTHANTILIFSGGRCTVVFARGYVFTTSTAALYWNKRSRICSRAFPANRQVPYMAMAWTRNLVKRRDHNHHFPYSPSILVMGRSGGLCQRNHLRALFELETGGS